MTKLTITHQSGKTTEVEADAWVDSADGTFIDLTASGHAVMRIRSKNVKRITRSMNTEKTTPATNGKKKTTSAK